MRSNPSRRIGAAAATAALLALSVTALGGPAHAATPAASATPAATGLVQVSSDPYTDSQAQHATEVEPDTFAFGTTVVSAFQVGRVFGGGASNIGWARSTDGGAHLDPRLPARHHRATPAALRPGQRRRRSPTTPSTGLADLLLGILPSGNVDVAVSRSTDGAHLGQPGDRAPRGTFDDKNWTVCDNHTASAFYGHCYTEYDDANAGDPST